MSLFIFFLFHMQHHPRRPAGGRKKKRFSAPDFSFLQSPLILITRVFFCAPLRRATFFSDFSKNRRSAGRSFFFKGVRSLQSYDGYDETSLLLRVLARGTLLQRTL